MNNIALFITGAASTFGAANIVDSVGTSALEVAAKLPEGSLDGLNTWDDIVKALISMLGGLLATVIITFLKKKFPELFGALKKRKKGKLD